MLFKAKDLEGVRLAAIDGAIGEVEECFFDDEKWTVRYLVVDTGGWLSGRRVLISPPSVRDVDIANGRVVVILTRTQVQDSPDVDAHQPISRRKERALLAYYGLPPYWVPLAVDPMMMPVAMPLTADPSAVADQETRQEGKPESEEEDAHLHSTRDVRGYDIQARDGEIGAVDDFLIDDHSWTIRWVVVDTAKWLLGKKVLVSPEWVDAVAWGDRALRVALTRDQIQNAPEYDPDEPVTREYEVRLFEYYGRRSYWDAAAA
jgi:PRC-barrel domain protein